MVNKVDQFSDSDDNVGATLRKAKQYLADNGVENAEIYPVAALPALLARQLDCGAVLSPGSKKEAAYMIEKLNDREDLHLEKYGVLSPSTRAAIDEMLTVARQNEDANAEALVHSGVISLELAIKQYVRKYAQASKINAAAEAIINCLSDVGNLESVKKEIIAKTAEHKRIAADIAAIEAKRGNAEDARKFEALVKEVITALKTGAKDEIVRIRKEYGTRTNAQLEEWDGQKIPIEEVGAAIERMTAFIAAAVGAGGAVGGGELGKKFTPKQRKEMRYKEVQFIQGEKLFNTFGSKVEAALLKQLDETQKWANSEADRLDSLFKHKFEQLEERLGEIITELRYCVSEKNTAERQLEMLKESEKRLEWVDGLLKQVDDMLEI